MYSLIHTSTSLQTVVSLKVFGMALNGRGVVMVFKKTFKFSFHSISNLLQLSTYHLFISLSLSLSLNFSPKHLVMGSHNGVTITKIQNKTSSQRLDILTTSYMAFHLLSYLDLIHTMIFHIKTRLNPRQQTHFYICFDLLGQNTECLEYLTL